jgi:hypothetical protein
MQNLFFDKMFYPPTNYGLNDSAIILMRILHRSFLFCCLFKMTVFLMFLSHSQYHILRVSSYGKTHIITNNMNNILVVIEVTMNVLII